LRKVGHLDVWIGRKESAHNRVVHSAVHVHHIEQVYMFVSGKALVIVGSVIIRKRKRFPCRRTPSPPPCIIAEFLFYLSVLIAERHHRAEVVMMQIERPVIVFLRGFKERNSLSVCKDIVYFPNISIGNDFFV